MSHSIRIQVIQPENSPGRKAHLLKEFEGRRESDLRIVVIHKRTGIVQYLFDESSEAMQQVNKAYCDTRQNKQ